MLMVGNKMVEITVPKTRIDLESLGLINQDLFNVEGNIASRYNVILKEIFELDSDLDAFRIDKRGLSPELSNYFAKKYPGRFEFGENYLNLNSANRFIIMVSPEQASAPLVAPQTSYDNELCDIIHKRSRHTIQDITQNEALFGELENGIDLFKSPYDLLNLRNIQVNLDSLNSTVQKILRLRKLSHGLEINNNALDNKYIREMKELVKEVGDERERTVSDIFPIKKEIHCFYAEFFKGVHILRNFEGSERLDILMIHDREYEPRYIGNSIVTITKDDPHLIDQLFKFNFLKYNPKLLESRIKSIEDEFLLDKGLDLVEFDSTDRIKHLYAHANEFPHIWEELKNIYLITNNQLDVDFSRLIESSSDEAKLKLATGSRKKEIINHLLAELDPTDYIRLYESNKKKLITDFSKYSKERKRYVAHKLLQYKAGDDTDENL